MRMTTIELTLQRVLATMAVMITLLGSSTVSQASERSRAARDGASAKGAPTNLVPWSDPPPQIPQPLVEELGERERRYDSMTWPQPPRLRHDLAPLAPDAEPGMKDDWSGSIHSGGERLSFGRFNSPIGSLSLISRDLDRHGRIRDISVLTFDDPNSNWDVNLKIRHGAMFQLTRKWGARGAPGPFVSERKPYPAPLSR